MHQIFAGSGLRHFQMHPKARFGKLCGPTLKGAAIQYFLKYLLPRDTTAAERHLHKFLSAEPSVLEYEHMDDAIAVLES
jgi:hypothetical protein